MESADLLCVSMPTAQGCRVSSRRAPAEKASTRPRPASPVRRCSAAAAPSLRCCPRTRNPPDTGWASFRTAQGTRRNSDGTEIGFPLARERFYDETLLLLLKKNSFLAHCEFLTPYTQNKFQSMKKK